MNYITFTNLEVDKKIEAINKILKKEIVVEKGFSIDEIMDQISGYRA